MDQVGVLRKDVHPLPSPRSSVQEPREGQASQASKNPQLQYKFAHDRCYCLPHWANQQSQPQWLGTVNPLTSMATCVGHKWVPVVCDKNAATVKRAKCDCGMFMYVL